MLVSQCEIAFVVINEKKGLKLVEKGRSMLILEQISQSFPVKEKFCEMWRK